MIISDNKFKTLVFEKTNNQCILIQLKNKIETFRRINIPTNTFRHVLQDLKADDESETQTEKILLTEKINDRSEVRLVKTVFNNTLIYKIQIFFQPNEKENEKVKEKKWLATRQLVILTKDDKNKLVENVQL